MYLWMDVVGIFRKGICLVLLDGLRLRYQWFQLLINLVEGFLLWCIVGYMVIVWVMGLFKWQWFQQFGVVCFVVNCQLCQSGCFQCWVDIVFGMVIELQVVDICQYLLLVSVVCFVVDKCDVLWFDVVGVYYVYIICQCIVYFFQYCLCQFCWFMLMCQVKKDVFSLWVVVWCVFVRQIGQELYWIGVFICCLCCCDQCWYVGEIG